MNFVTEPIYTVSENEIKKMQDITNEYINLCTKYSYANPVVRENIARDIEKLRAQRSVMLKNYGSLS